MITFTVLAIILLILVALAVIILSVGGATFIAIFADLIVCIAIIAMIIKLLARRKRNRR